MRRFFWEDGLGKNFLKVAWSVTRISGLRPNSNTSLLGVERERREDSTEVLPETEYFSSDTLA